MYTRTNLLRDALVFQGKLLLDGLRDLLLFPVSLIAVSVDLLAGGTPPGRNFRDVLLFGRRTEGWIRLFSGADRVAPTAPQAPADESGDSANVDALVSEVEKMIVRELERDRGSGSPRDLVDRVWKRIDQRRRALRRLRDRQQGPD